jgi:hypothetical protein
VKKFAKSTCGGTADEKGTTTTLSSSTSLEACSKACDLLEDDCMEFYHESTANTCEAYSNKCTFVDTTDQKDAIYERVPCCFWTSPTLIETDSLCGMETDSTINGAAGMYDYTILDNNNVNYNIQTCHQLCVDFDNNCQSFAFVKDGTGCKLYM